MRIHNPQCGWARLTPVHGTPPPPHLANKSRIGAHRAQSTKAHGRPQLSAREAFRKKADVQRTTQPGWPAESGDVTCPEKQ